MRKLILLLGLLCPTLVAAAPSSIKPPLRIQENDGSPSCYPWRLDVTNGSLVCNADGTADLSTSGGGAGLDPSTTWYIHNQVVRQSSSTLNIDSGTISNLCATNVTVYTTGLSINGLDYTWPSHHEPGFLHNDGYGTLIWTSTGTLYGSSGGVGIVSLSTGVTGVLGLAHGGTGFSATSWANGEVMIGDGSTLGNATIGNCPTSGNGISWNSSTGSFGCNTFVAVTATSTFTAPQTIASSFTIISTGTTPAFTVTANGTYGTTNGSSGGFFVNCTGGAAASGMCMQLFSSAGAQNALGGMLNIVNTNTAYNEPAIYTQRPSNTNNNSDIRVEAGGTPAISLLETNQTIGSAKKFQWSVHSGTMRFEGRNTSDNAFVAGIIMSSAASHYDVTIGEGYNSATDTQLQVITSTANIYALAISTAVVGGNSITISTSMGMTFNNTTDGRMGFTIGSSTYGVTSSSGGYTVGQNAVFSSTNGTLIGSSNAGTPGGSTGQLQYNNAGAFGGVPGSVVTASSITQPYTVILGSMIVLSGTGASGNAIKGLVDIYGQSVPVNTPLLSVGSSTQGSAFYILSNAMPNAAALGLVAGSLALGDVTNSWANRIYATGDNTQFFDLRTGSTMTFQTATTNGQGNMMFNAGGTVPIFKISKFTGVGISSSAALGSYMIKFSTMGIISVSSNTPVLSGCGTGPSVRGNSFRFQITGGTGATGCVATFPAGTFPNNAPMCVVDQSAMSLVNALSHTETNSAITITQTGLGTGVLTVSCVGFNE